MDDALAPPSARSPHILTLPTELVTLIWRWSLYYPDFPQPDGSCILISPGFAYGFTSVCRRWKQIALTTPWLWSEYVLTNLSQFRVLPLLLARSGKVPVTITFAAGRLDSKRPDITDTWLPKQRWLHSAQQTTWKPCLDVISSHMDHMKALRFQVNHVDDLHVLLAAFSHEPAPLMEEFVIALPDHSSGFDIDMTGFFSGCHLHILSLTVFPTDWSAQIFRDVRDFAFTQRTRSMYPQVEFSRTRAVHRSITPGDIAELLRTAPHLQKLCIWEGYLHPATNPDSIAERIAASALRTVHITADCSDPAMFAQLSRIIPMSAIPNLDLVNVPVSGARHMLGHLEGLLDCVLWTERPFVLVTDISKLHFRDWVRNDAYDFGSWHLSCSDSRQFLREFTLGEEHLPQARMFLAACSDSMRNVRRLRIRASQWPQISSALRGLDLCNVEEIVIKVVLDRILPYENNSEMHAFYQRLRLSQGAISAPHVPPFLGSVIRLPSLLRLVLCGECHHPEADVFLPMHITGDVFSSMIASLGILHSLTQVRLHDIRPSDENALGCIQKLAEDIVLSDTGNYAGECWWKNADMYEC